MTTPDMPSWWPGFARPMLEVLADGDMWRTADLFQAITDNMGFTTAQQAEQTESGANRLRTRMAWALSSLTRAAAVRKMRYGHSVITDVGRQLLADHPDELTAQDIESLPAFREYVPKRAQEPADGSAQRPRTTQIGCPTWSRHCSPMPSNGACNAVSATNT